MPNTTDTEINQATPAANTQATATPVPDGQRVPAATSNPLGGEKIQVNFCKNPVCSNYGVPARTTPVKSGPSEDRDDCYVVQSTSGGGAPGIRCKSCGEKPIIKSNAGIAEEINRLMGRLHSGFGCPDPACKAHGLDIDQHPFLYSKNGHTNAGTARLICKLCGNDFTTARKAKFVNPDNTAKVFSCIINKVPMRRTLEIIGWNGMQTRNYYRRMDLIARRCHEFSAIYDRKLERADCDLGRLVISTDIQQYTINWDDNKKRENTLVNAVFHVENASGFIFGAHAAYDPDIDAEAADADMVESGDHRLPEAYRRHARLWMLGDEYERNRGAGKEAGIKTRADLIAKIEAEYAAAIARKDTEDGESGSKPPKKGKLVHYPYTVYGSMFLLERLLCGADKVVHCLDHESVLRAACLTAFENRIRKGTAHAFYVSVGKDYTVPERQKICAEAKRKFCLANRASLKAGASENELVAQAMKSNIRAARKLGPWQDQWVQHPLPRMDEPEKQLCWLTGRGPSLSDDTVDMFLKVSMNGADNAFQQVRRRISMLERPLLTASAQRRSWNGYAFYKPENVQKALNIFRCYLNFCVKRESDGQTAAMRLGIARRAYTIDDILNHAVQRDYKTGADTIRALQNAA